MNTKLGVVHKTKQGVPEIVWHPVDRIEPGEYIGFCRSADVYFDSKFHRWVCATQWDIFDDSRINVICRLTKFFNLGEGKKPRATSRRSNYWRAWVDANGGHPPQRGQRMRPEILIRRFARVEVADVEKDFNQMALSRDEVYSVIRRILTWETGMP